MGVKDKFVGFNKKVKEFFRYLIDLYLIDYLFFLRFMDYFLICVVLVLLLVVFDVFDGSVEKVLIDGLYSDLEL